MKFRSFFKGMITRLRDSAWMRPSSEKVGDTFTAVQSIDPQYNRQRLVEIFGDERLSQQLLYENWVVKDSWRFREEALPLLCGMDPERFSETMEGRDSMEDLWSHARQCVEQNLLPVINRDMPEEEWRVEPLAVYHWAVISRVPLPEAFISLMEFVARTVKSPVRKGDREEAGDGVKMSAGFDHDREKVLGLALAMVAACPDRCRNHSGRVTADGIMRVLHERPDWLTGQSLMMKDPAMRDLIEKWLNVRGLPANE
jgi:hypothetical protein